MSIKTLLINYPYPYHPSGEERFDFNYGIGRLVAYLKQVYDEPEALDIRIKWSVLNPSATFFSECVEWKPDIVGLSCFIWNHAAIVETVQTLRNALGNCVIVLGGPAADYLYKKHHGFGGHPVYAIRGAGEVPFAAFIKQFIRGALTGRGTVPIENLIEYRNHGFIENPPWLQSESLDFLPSPFTQGVLAPGPNDQIMFLEASRGCDRKCAYCFAHTTSLKCGIARFSPAYLVRELMWAYSNNVRNIDLIEVSIGRDMKWLTGFVDAVLEFEELETMHFALNLHPADLTPELVRQMERLGKRITHIVIGIQSLKTQTAKIMHRPLLNIPELSEKLEAYAMRLPLKVELIAGLPGDTPASLENAVLFLSKFPVSQIIINRLTLIPGTEYFEKRDEYRIVMDEYKMFQVVRTPAFDSQYLDTLHQRLLDLVPGQRNRIVYHENKGGHPQKSISDGTIHIHT